MHVFALCKKTGDNSKNPDRHRKTMQIPHRRAPGQESNLGRFHCKSNNLPNTSLQPTWYTHSTTSDCLHWCTAFTWLSSINHHSGFLSVSLCTSNVRIDPYLQGHYRKCPPIKVYLKIYVYLEINLIWEVMKWSNLNKVSVTHFTGQCFECCTWSV